MHPLSEQAMRQQATRLCRRVGCNDITPQVMNEPPSAPSPLPRTCPNTQPETARRPGNTAPLAAAPVARVGQFTSFESSTLCCQPASTARAAGQQPGLLTRSTCGNSSASFNCGRCLQSCGGSGSCSRSPPLRQQQQLAASSISCCTGTQQALRLRAAAAEASCAAHPAVAAPALFSAPAPNPAAQLDCCSRLLEATECPIRGSLHDAADRPQRLHLPLRSGC